MDLTSSERHIKQSGGMSIKKSFIIAVYVGTDYSNYLSRVIDTVWETDAKSPETLGWSLGCFLNTHFMTSLIFHFTVLNCFMKLCHITGIDRAGSGTTLISCLNLQIIYHNFTLQATTNKRQVYTVLLRPYV